MQKIWWNNSLADREHRLVGAGHRGWRYGDGIFESMRIEDGTPRWKERHLARFAAGSAALRLAFDPAQVEKGIAAILSANSAKSGVLRLSLSRRAGGQGYLPGGEEADLLIETSPLPPDRGPLLAIRSRWCKIPPSCLPAECKTAQSLTSVLALQEARDQKADEAVLLTPEGDLASFASGNLFWQRAGILHTPDLSTGCLPGVYRALLLELAKGALAEVRQPLAMLDEADAVIFTNSVRLAVPVEEIVGVGRFPGSVRLAEACNHLIQAA